MISILNNFKKSYVSQLDESDCGVAALAMILKYYGSSISLAHLRNIANTDSEGTTALGLIKTAQSFNFDTKAIHTDMNSFKSEKISFPFIAHIIKDESILHYYVVQNITKKYVLIADPDPKVGIVKMSREKFSKEWSGVALFFAPKSTYRPVKDNKETLLSFVPEVLKQKELIINIVLAALLTTIISIIGSYFLQVIIDTYIPNNMKNTLSIVSISLLIFYFFQAVFSYAQNFLLAILGQRLSIDIVLGYIKHIFKLPMSFFATRNIGEVVSRFNDANKIIDALASATIAVLLDIGITILMGIVLAIQSVKLFWITLLSLPVYGVIVFTFIKPFRTLNQKEMESNAILSSSIIEDIRGIETIKALNSENQRYQRIDHQFVDYLKKNLAYTKSDVLQQSLKGIIQLILNVFILWIGASLVIQNKLTIGQLMTYNALLAYFVNPLQSIINLQPKLQSARVANTRLNEIYLIESEFKSKQQNIIDKKGILNISNVSYRYGYNKNVLKNISLTIKENEKIAIVGMSGSGKSTLAKLLVNFFTPIEGEIFLNDQPIKSIDKHCLRGFINYTPQDPYTFSGTILNNLQLGNRKGTTFKDVLSACKLAMIDNDIEKMPLQFNTFLDENGNVLSGGQKQRLSIARAILSPAKILIFDESTSGLDTITENRLVTNLLGLENRTIIFIAHRMSIAKMTDNIVVIDNGKVVEKGNHRSLLAQKGYYYKLVNN